MTTTGERLVSLSGLPTGSALDHLLAISIGSGAGDSFYSGTVRVVTSHPEVFVHRKAKRAAIEHVRIAPHPSAPKKKATRTSAVYIFSAQNTAYSLTHPEEVFVSAITMNETTVMTADNSVSAMKKAN